MKKLSLIVTIVLLLVVGSSAKPTYQDLVEALEVKDDNLAVSLVDELEEQEASFGLFYNQGLAYRYQRRFALSRAAFEKALSYDPRSLSTRRRLREVKEQLSPDLAKLDVISTPLYTRSEAEVVLLLPLLALLVLAGARFGGRAVTQKSLLTTFGLFLLLGGLALWNNPPEETAVIISPTTKLLNEASSDSTGTTLPEGVLVEVLAEDSHFVEIELGDGKTGWVRGAELQKVSKAHR